MLASSHCRGDAPVTWSRSDECRSAPSRCGAGDVHFALNFYTMVPRCGKNGDALRTFNRSMMTACMDELAARKHRSSVAVQATPASFRALLMGVSNCFFVWAAMAVDESDHWPSISRSEMHGRKPTCQPVRPDLAHWVFRPHAVDYIPWNFYTPTIDKAMTTAASVVNHMSCLATGAIGGGALQSLTWSSTCIQAVFDLLGGHQSGWV